MIYNVTPSTSMRVCYCFTNITKQMRLDIFNTLKGLDITNFILAITRNVNANYGIRFSGFFHRFTALVAFFRLLRTPTNAKPTNVIRCWHEFMNNLLYLGTEKHYSLSVKGPYRLGICF